MDEPVIASKLASALVNQAAFAPGLEFALDSGGRIPVGTDHVVKWFQQFYGGVWVGGRATLTARRLHFAANQLNRMVHTGTLEVDIDLREVMDVALRQGWVTGIVVVWLPGAELWFRCVGAGAFRDQIADAVRGCHGHV